MKPTSSIDQLKQFIDTLPEGERAKIITCAQELEGVLKKYQNLAPIAFALVAEGIANNPFKKRP